MKKTAFLYVLFFTAEIYALIGEKTKASEFLAKAVAEGKESCCYEFGFLLGAGKVFERQKLKADANIQKALREFTVSAF